MLAHLKMWKFLVQKSVDVVVVVVVFQVVVSVEQGSRNLGNSNQ